MSERRSRGATQTVLALFDDQIDAEQALESLRKASRPGGSVSVLARDRRLMAAGSEGRLDVADAIMDTALTAVSGWLPGLAALVVPEHGSFLVGGPMGVVLAQRQRQAGLGTIEAGAVPDATFATSLGATLQRFGFRPEEAHYLEERLAAGSALIAVSASARAHIDATLSAFADHGAVYIGQAETAAEVVRETKRLLSRPLESTSEQLIVTDIVAPLDRACGQSGLPAQAWCNRSVFDSDESDIGSIDDVLIEHTAGDGGDAIRYVVVGSGGVLGFGRRRVAVPAALVRLEDDAVRLDVARLALADAPTYDQSAPFSRSDELALHTYFGTAPYWLGTAGAR
jgi:hypothetical protein